LDCPTVMVSVDKNAENLSMTSLAVGPDQPARLAGLDSSGKYTWWLISVRFCSACSFSSPLSTSPLVRSDRFS
jgi:hypothetical protein